MPATLQSPQMVAARPASAASKALAEYYRRLQNDLLVQGLLRQDGGGVDTRYGPADLVRNFEQIAFFDEYSATAQGFTARQTASRLRRWDDPIVISISFGASVPSEQQARDRANITNYAARLARVTGHPISVGARGNFNVIILNEDERVDFSPQMARLAPAAGQAAAHLVANLGRSDLCLVFASPKSATSYSYGQAVAIVRAEHPDLLRLSCFHEEIAQGLGLANDSPYARPSIFNDDEEFALLTSHDEQLLSMLYNRALRPGMTWDQAQPIVHRLAAGQVARPF